MDGDPGEELKEKDSEEGELEDEVELDVVEVPLVLRLVGSVYDGRDGWEGLVRTLGGDVEPAYELTAEYESGCVHIPAVR